MDNNSMMKYALGLGVVLSSFGYIYYYYYDNNEDDNIEESKNNKKSHHL